MNKRIRAGLGWLLCLSVLTGCGWFAAAEPTDGASTAEIAVPAGQEADESTGAEYAAGYAALAQEERPQQAVEMSAAEAVGNTTATVGDRTAVQLTEGSAAAEWQFTVDTTGAYALYVTYQALPGSGKNPVIRVLVDGALPFTESGSLSLCRLWKDAVQEDGSVIRRDSSGDDLRPEQVEVFRWNECSFIDSVGLYGEPYLYHLSAGQHTLRLERVQEDVAVAALRFANEEEIPSYETYHARFTRADLAQVKEVCYLQAEAATEKNSRVLYPVYDRSSAATQPNDPDHVRLNTIGQSNWNTVGQAISWTVNVPEAGLYKIAFRAKQNYNTGMASRRKLYINGKVPFREAASITFAYQEGWQIVTLGGKNAYYVWLEPGDTLTLECTTGNMSAALRSLQQTVQELNALYRKIIVITGSSPDMYQDYYLEEQIPGLQEGLDACRRTMDEIARYLDRLNGGKSPLASTVRMTATVTGDLAEDPYYIPSRLDSFKSGIESLGSLINSLAKQPLELDYLAFVPSGVALPEPNAGFFENLSFGFRKFVASFSKDYEGMTGADKTLQVWVATGRDQVQVLKNMTDDSFSPQAGITVRMSLVDTGTNLIKATLAGKGPDVALMMPESTPVNLAMRGMLMDLTPYVTEQTLQQFRSSALTPFYYNGGLYALPETEVFDMLFYRSDILEELGLQVPNTWEEFYSAIKVLQGNNLGVGVAEINSGNMGVSAGIGTFNKFLFQTGGTYYDEGLTTTCFETPTAQDAFTRWVELYSLYGLDRSFDFYNRFRSGEMPLGITSYTAYNQLYEAAPEIRGLWNFAPVPGTLRADGTLDRSESTSVTGSIIISRAEQHGLAEEAVSFVQWWTGTESQARFGRELEAILGVSARYTTANLAAAQQLGWTAAEWQVLQQQGEHLMNVPEIPGNYVVSRSLTSAFRAALNGKNTPARSLSLYNKDICREITRKREEFGLN